MGQKTASRQAVMNGHKNESFDNGEASSSGRSSEEQPLIDQNGHGSLAEFSLAEMAEEVASAAPHLGSVLSADLDELPKGELTGEQCAKSKTPLLCLSIQSFLCGLS